MLRAEYTGLDGRNVGQGSTHDNSVATYLSLKICRPLSRDAETGGGGGGGGGVPALSALDFSLTLAAQGFADGDGDVLLSFADDPEAAAV